MTSAMVKTTARNILRALREQPEGLSKDALCRRLGVSAPSVQRAMTWLRDECDSPLEFRRPGNVWVLADLRFTLPLSDPQPGDLAAVMFAEALLSPIADPEITSRIRRLSEQMDSEIRASTRTKLRANSVVASATTASPANPQVLSILLENMHKAVVEIRYARVWSESGQRSARFRVEPWQLRVHDGQLYLRAFSLTHDEPRTFRVAQIDGATAQAEPARHRVPTSDELWGAADPAFGIDVDRPGDARVWIGGAVARWVARTVWHPSQRDSWIEVEGESILQRSFRFGSTRELARRLLELGGGLRRVEPPRVREAIVAQAREMVEQLSKDE